MRNQNADVNLSPISSVPLSAQAFASVVAGTPLVAIDFIVEDEAGEVLLGLRNNAPAKGYWFVPGGRILKNETLGNAFARLAQDELGLRAQMMQSRFAGIYEHFYDTDFAGTVDATTHYLVLAYRLQIERASLQPPHEQHSQYLWIQAGRVARLPNVHPYTEAYFQHCANASRGS